MCRLRFIFNHSLDKLFDEVKLVKSCKTKLSVYFIFNHSLDKLFNEVKLVKSCKVKLSGREVSTHDHVVSTHEDTWKLWSYLEKFKKILVKWRKLWILLDWRPWRSHISKEKTSWRTWFDRRSNGQGKQRNMVWARSVNTCSWGVDTWHYPKDWLKVSTHQVEESTHEDIRLWIWI